MTWYYYYITCCAIYAVIVIIKGYFDLRRDKSRGLTAEERKMLLRSYWRSSPIVLIITTIIAPVDLIFRVLMAFGLIKKPEDDVL